MVVDQGTEENSKLCDFMIYVACFFALVFTLFSTRYLHVNALQWTAMSSLIIKKKIKAYKLKVALVVW